MLINRLWVMLKRVEFALAAGPKRGVLLPARFSVLSYGPTYPATLD